jgi:hypothetical protein
LVALSDRKWNLRFAIISSVKGKMASMKGDPIAEVGDLKIVVTIVKAIIKKKTSYGKGIRSSLEMYSLVSESVELCRL